MIELPLLFENKLQNYFSHTLSVFAPIHIMQDRLSKRGLSHSEANARISCQLSAEQKADLADYVLWGGGSEKFLLNQVENLNSTLN